MNGLVPTLSKFIKRNSTTILSILASAGVITTSILVAKEAPEVKTKIQYAEEEKGENLTISEKVKEGLPEYVPAIITGVGTIACIFSVDVLSKKKIAALEGAYILLQQQYKEYREKVLEIGGEDLYKKVDYEIAKDHCNINGVTVEGDVMLFYDRFSQRYFESTMLKVVDAQNKTNRLLNQNGHVVLNDYYALLDNDDLEWMPEYDSIGWNIFAHEGRCGLTVYDTSWIEFEHDKAVLDDGLECCIISFNVDPDSDYLDY